MALNGLVANPSKTVFMILNRGRGKEEEKLQHQYHVVPMGLCQVGLKWGWG